MLQILSGKFVNDNNNKNFTFLKLAFELKTRGLVEKQSARVANSDIPNVSLR